MTTVTRLNNHIKPGFITYISEWSNGSCAIIRGPDLGRLRRHGDVVVVVVSRQPGRRRRRRRHAE